VVPVESALESRDERPLEVGPRAKLAADVRGNRGNEVFQEAAEDLVDHRLPLESKWLVEAAGQEPGVGDVADGGGAQPVLGEQPGGDREQLGAPVGAGAALMRLVDTET